MKELTYKFIISVDWCCDYKEIDKPHPKAVLEPIGYRSAYGDLVFRDEWTVELTYPELVGFVEEEGTFRLASTDMAEKIKYEITIK